MHNALAQHTVFVSSSSDLHDLRNICLQVTWAAGHSAKGVLSPLASLDVRREIQSSSLLVRICSKIDEDTERECFWAADFQRPYLVHVVAEDPDLGAIKRLVDSAPSGSQVRVAGAEGLTFAKDHLIALHQLVRVLDLAAPNRALFDSPEARRNPFLRRIDSRLIQWATLNDRFNANPILKHVSADFFLDQYLDLLLQARLARIFVESGSSTAIFSELLTGRVRDPRWLDGTRIETNNFVSYLDFILSEIPQVTLYPPGTPDNKYGGTFGALTELRATTEAAHPIAGRAFELVEEIRQHFAEQYGELGLIIGATSGIDLSVGQPFAGPHSGSYWNMLFKRALHESNTPMVMLLDEDKLPRAANRNECYPVCNDDLPWEYVCRNTPLAFACAFRSEERAGRMVEELNRLGMVHVQRGKRGVVPFPIICSNEPFWLQRAKWIELARGADKGLTRTAAPDCRIRSVY